MSPIDVQDILERARGAVRVGDHETAERLLRQYLTREPDSRDARILLGATFAREGKLAEAADEFIGLLSKDPGDIEALNNAAVICRRQGKNRDALEYLKEAIELDPSRAEFHYNIGNIHKQLGNHKAASMAYARVIELDPSYVPAYNNLGTIYEQLGEYDKAYNIFRKGLALDQNNPTLRFNYGIALEANGRLEDAANAYRSALRSKPGWLEPMNNLGIVFFKQGRHDKAVATFKRVLSTEPFNAEARNNMGVVLADQGKTPEAIKCYRQAIEADHHYTKAMINLERALESLGDFSDALIELEKLARISPPSADIRNRLAALYLKMERYPEALEQAEAALEWEPENIQSLRTKGAALRITGNDTAARECFEKILSIDPSNYSFHLDLADIHFKRQEYREAEERIRDYLVRRPNDRNAKFLLGRLCAAMGNRVHAIQIFEDLARADPSDAEALAAAAELHKRAGSLEKALRAADTLVNLQGKRATADDLSELNKSLEFYESAVNAYSTSARDMWERNVRVLTGDDEKEPEKEDLSLFMGAAGLTQEADQEPDDLFTEEMELLSGEEEYSGELVLDDEAFEELSVDETPPPPRRDPLDALTEALLSRDPARENSGAVPASRPERSASASGEAEVSEVPDELPAEELPAEELPADVALFSEEPEQIKAEETAPLPAGEEPLPGEAVVFLEAEVSEAPDELPAAELPADVALFSEEPEQIETEETTPLPADVALFSEEPEQIEADETTPLPAGEEPFPGEAVVFLEAEVLEAPDELSAEELPADVALFSEEFEQIETDETEVSEPDFLSSGEGISTVITLLDYLKRMTGELPREDRDFFSGGKFPAALERVIDRLGKLAIIKERVAAPRKPGPEFGGVFNGR